MTCETPCVFERVKQHSQSVAIVENEEKVCRFGYFPMHYDKREIVQKSLIRNNDLKRGKLSLWRLNTTSEKQNLDRLVNKSLGHTPEGQMLRQVFCPLVSDIRTIAIDAKRVFCVIDDCAISENGDFDIDHCVIQPCKVQFGESFELLSNSTFQIIRNKLFEILEESAIEINSNM